MMFTFVVSEKPVSFGLILSHWLTMMASLRASLIRSRQTVIAHLPQIMEKWNEHCPSDDPRIISIIVDDASISAALADGRVISVPLAWSWRLSDASPAQRSRYEIIGNGQGVHWPNVDEDISARGMLNGIPARPPKQTA